MDNYLIVSQHPGAIEWLKQRGIVGDVISHVDDVSQIKDKVVIGNLPYFLARECRKVGIIEMPKLPKEMRGKDLTPNEMDSFGARISWYKVSISNKNS